jgi:hypothetical protein
MALTLGVTTPKEDVIFEQMNQGMPQHNADKTKPHVERQTSLGMHYDTILSDGHATGTTPILVVDQAERTFETPYETIQIDTEHRDADRTF